MQSSDLQKFLRELPIAIAMLIVATLYLTALSAPSVDHLSAEHLRDMIAMAD